ncbi:MAG TPA: WD40 repeat domain-containing protein [Planctomycetota bacterium]|nr:WD40 repeat domain-containing protein [Planctomycetota bacterium]
MSEDQSVKSRRDWQIRVPRVSLALLLYTVLFIGALNLLWLNSEPWRLELRMSEEPFPNVYSAFSNDGSEIIQYDVPANTVRRWSAKSYAPLESFKIEQNGKVIQTQRGLLLLIDTERKFEIFDLAANRSLWTLTGDIQAWTLSPNGKLLLAEFAGRPTSLRLLDIDSGRMISEYGETLKLDDLVFSQDSKFFARLSAVNQLTIWNTKTGQVERTVTWTPESQELQLSALGPGADLVVLSKTGMLDCRTGVFRMMEGYCFDPYPFSSDGSRLSGDALIDTDTGRSLSKLYGGPYCFSPSNDRLCRVSFFDGAWIYDAKSGTFLTAFSPRKTRLHPVLQLKEWLLPPEQRPIVSPMDSGSPNSSPQFSKDGNLLLLPNAVWRRVRPEWWWGYFWLPECWLCLILLAAMLREVWRLRKAPAPIQRANAVAA